VPKKNTTTLKMESFISNGPFIFKNKMAGTNKIDDLDDKSLTKGTSLIN